MKVFYVLIIMLFLVGCSKEEPKKEVETQPEIVEVVEVEKTNEYFFNEDYKNYDYNFFLDGVTTGDNKVKIDVTEIKTSDYGKVYEIKVLGREDIPVEETNLGYFFVTEDLIIKLESIEKADSITQDVTLDNATTFGDIVCSSDVSAVEDITMEDGGVKTLSENGDEVTFSYYNDSEDYLKYRKSFTWKKGYGLVSYNYFTIENESMVDLRLIKDASMKAQTKEITYFGNIDDIDVHMSLNYNTDGTVTGTYYYDEHKQNIELTGTKESNCVKLTTKDGSENFEGYVFGNYITGDWSSNGKTLNFEVYNENYDEYSFESNYDFNSDIIEYKDYVYYATLDGIYRININTDVKEFVTDGYRMSIHNNKLYFKGESAQMFRADLDGKNVESFEINQHVGIKSYYVYKDRVYYTLDDDFEMANIDDNVIASTDLDFKDYKELELPNFTFDGPDYRKDYHIDLQMKFIYNDYIYFDENETSPDPVTVRVKIDGSDSDVIYNSIWDMGFAADGHVFSGWGERRIIHKSSTENLKNSGSELAYGVKIEDDITDVIGKSVTKNGEYLVVYNNLEYNDYHLIQVVDFDGSIVNEIKVDKLGLNYDGRPNEDMYLEIFGDYIYFNINGGNREDYFGRVKTLGDEVKTWGFK